MQYSKHRGWKIAGEYVEQGMQLLDGSGSAARFTASDCIPYPERRLNPGHVILAEVRSSEEQAQSSCIVLWREEGGLPSTMLSLT